MANNVNVFICFQTRKNSPTHIKRPMNAFMVFSHHERRKVITEDPRLENTQISKELGRRWKQLSEEERVPYIREADKLRQYHQREYPDYKYKPIKKKTVRMKYPSEENTTARPSCCRISAADCLMIAPPGARFLRTLICA